MILLLKIAPKYSAGVLSIVSKHGKAVMYFTEKICMLDKLHSGMSHSATGCELNVYKSTICIKQCVFKQKHR